MGKLLSREAVRQLTLNEEIQRPAQAIGKLVSVENANCLQHPLTLQDATRQISQSI